MIIPLCLLCSTASAQTNTATQLKAAFLYNFAKFVTWPPANTNSPQFVIGIMGNDPFGAFLEQLVEGEKIGNQPIVIQRYNDVSEIRTCHILYINKDNGADVAKSLENRPILTVGEGNGFAQEGGIIRFYFTQNKIRLRINLKHTRAANLQISSKLLRLADVVD
jgi:hypothetical protein